MRAMTSVFVILCLAHIARGEFATYEYEGAAELLFPVSITFDGGGITSGGGSITGTKNVSIDVGTSSQVVRYQQFDYHFPGFQVSKSSPQIETILTFSALDITGVDFDVYDIELASTGGWYHATLESRDAIERGFRGRFTDVAFDLDYVFTGQTETKSGHFEDVVATSGIGVFFGGDQTNFPNHDIFLSRIYTGGDVPSQIVFDSSNEFAKFVKPVPPNLPLQFGEIVDGVPVSVDVSPLSLFFDGAILLNRIERHAWNTSSPSENWSDGNNWDAGGIPPQSNWKTVLENTSVPGGQTAIVDADSTVMSVDLRGTAGPMTLEISSGVTLTVTNHIRVNQGSILKGDGNILGDIINDGGTITAGMPEPSSGMLLLLGVVQVVCWRARTMVPPQGNARHHARQLGR